MGLNLPHPSTSGPSETNCVLCKPDFKSRLHLKRHKSTAAQQHPASEQSGSRLCSVCNLWFWSAGGLKVHKCQQKNAICQPLQLPDYLPVHLTDRLYCHSHCSVCDRCLNHCQATAVTGVTVEREALPLDRKVFEFTCFSSCRFHCNQDLVTH